VALPPEPPVPGEAPAPLLVVGPEVEEVEPPVPVVPVPEGSDEQAAAVASAASVRVR